MPLAGGGGCPPKVSLPRGAASEPLGWGLPVLFAKSKGRLLSNLSSFRLATAKKEVGGKVVGHCSVGGEKEVCEGACH